MYSAEATSMLPMPIVVAFDGPCRRVKMSGMRSRPSEPISENTAPTSTSAATIQSSSVAVSIVRPYSMTSPRVRNFDSTTVVMKPSIAISSAAS